MLFLLQLWAIVMGLSLLGVIAQWPVIRAFRLPVTGVSLFYGFTIAKIPMFRGHLTIGSIPLGFGIEVDQTANLRIGWGRRLLILLTPPAAMLALGGIVLGWADALHHFAAGFWQLPSGAWQPLAKAPYLIGQWHAVLSSDWLAAAAILGTKQATFALLPFGGSTVTNLLAVLGERRQDPTFEKVAIYSALIGLMLTFLWIFSSACHALFGVGW